MPQVVVKNVTASPVFVESLGIEIGVYSGLGDEVDLTDQFEFSDIVEAEDLEQYVQNGEFVVNDGTTDLNVADGLLHISFESAFDERGLTYLENFAPEVTERLSRMDVNFRNILVNALAIRAASSQEIDPDLSVFVDSFETDDEIDPTSSNYFIDGVSGYVGLNPGGSLSLTETLEADFAAGTHVNTEEYSETGGDGSVRKSKTIIGAVVISEDFEDVSNVDLIGTEIVFEDDFEDGDITDWTLDPISGDAQTGLTTANIVGSYGLQIDANDRYYSPTFSCVGKTGVKFRCYLGGFTLNGPDELMMVGWYDGTTWHEIASSNNAFGYKEFDIPDAWLASNNQLVIDLTNNATLLSGTNGGGDHGVIDDILVTAEITDTNIDQVSDAALVLDGTYAGKITLDFGIDDEFSFRIDLTDLDVSTYKYLRLYFLKPDDNNVYAEIVLTDTSGDSYAYTATPLSNGDSYASITVELADSFGDIDEANLEFIRVNFTKQSADEIILDVPTVNTTIHGELNENTSIKQSFVLAEEVYCQRVLLRIKWEDAQPADDLFIAIANIFDTTLATGRLPASGASASWADYIIELDNPVLLRADTQYAVLAISPSTLGGDGWDLKETTNGERYTDGNYFYNGNDQANSLRFQLLKPVIRSDVYVDNLEIESESTYNTTGTFTSQGINLGLVPDDLDLLSWIEDLDGDTLSVRIRFAATEGGLSSASWSASFTDATGVGNVLTGITPNQWFQYEVSWTGGGSTSSSALRSLTLEYSVSAGSGSAEVISKAETTTEIPTEFIMSWIADTGTGTIDFYISRDGQTTWQSVAPGDENEFTDFTAAVGTTLHMKAVITGNAKLYGWSLGTNQPFI